MPKSFLPLMAALFVTLEISASAKEPIFLGPANSGPASGGANWLTGANGAGYTAVDFDDAARDGFDFTISNSVAGKENTADWRCPPFSLGAAADGARPLTFSFAYKLVNAVAKGNNVHVQLRFFDATGTNFISELVLPLGAHTGNSRMGDYKTLTFSNIFAPRKAGTADVWIDANFFEPWVSGTARFGDISVTTLPRSLLFQAGVIAIALIGIGALVILSICLWRRRSPAH
jgi:hypothetical protein